MARVLLEVDRFATKIALTEHGCIEWTGGLSGAGYGHFHTTQFGGVKARDVFAHRWSYEHHVGPVPEGLYLDHLCRNRACVNPDHLEPVTHRTNCLRGVGFAAINAAKTECQQGHKFTPANTYVDREGYRHCRACRREVDRRRRPPGTRSRKVA